MASDSPQIFVHGRVDRVTELVLFSVVGVDPGPSQFVTHFQDLTLVAVCRNVPGRRQSCGTSADYADSHISRETVWEPNEISSAERAFIRFTRRFVRRLSFRLSLVARLIACFVSRDDGGVYFSFVVPVTGTSGEFRHPKRFGAITTIAFVCALAAKFCGALQTTCFPCLSAR